MNGPGLHTHSPEAERDRATSNSLEAQRQRVLARLVKGPASTADLRDRDDVIHPAGRVKELRRQGHNISLCMVWQPTARGGRRMIGVYSLETPAA